jgi:hypothetical protein
MSEFRRDEILHCGGRGGVNDQVFVFQALGAQEAEDGVLPCEGLLQAGDVVGGFDYVGVWAGMKLEGWTGVLGTTYGNEAVDSGRERTETFRLVLRSSGRRTVPTLPLACFR